MARSRSDHCPCSGCNLERLIAPSILACLAGGDLHGYQIVQRLGDMPMQRGEMPDSAGVYRQLRMMESKGLLEARWEAGKSGPAKRLYHLTACGRDCMKRWVDTLGEYHLAVGRLRSALSAALKGKRRSVRQGG